MLSKLVGRSGEVEFDAVLDESITTDSDVTEHPVDEGADIADHIQAKPDTIPISGIITGERASEKLAQLLRFQHDREVLTFIGVETAEQVVIASLTRRRSAQIGDGFEFSLQLREIRVAKLKKAAIAVPKKSVNKTQVKKKTSKGKQQPKKKKPKQPKPTTQKNFKSSRNGIERLGL